MEYFTMKIEKRPAKRFLLCLICLSALIALGTPAYIHVSDGGLLPNVSGPRPISKPTPPAQPMDEDTAVINPVRTISCSCSVRCGNQNVYSIIENASEPEDCSETAYQRLYTNCGFGDSTQRFVCKYFEASFPTPPTSLEILNITDWAAYVSALPAGTNCNTFIHEHERGYPYSTLYYSCYMCDREQVPSTGDITGEVLCARLGP
jgi:hypothetical protein